MTKNSSYHGVMYKHSELTVDFGPKPEQKRRSFDNNRKEWWLADQAKS